MIFVSDNESWVDQGRGHGTELMAQWATFRQRNPRARLVCLDIQPNQTTQAAERADILNIGGFSDRVFEAISAFASGQLETDHWWLGSRESLREREGPNAGGTTLLHDMTRLSKNLSAS